MLNLDNIDMTKQYASTEEAVSAIRSYIYQLYMELDFRLEELDKRIKELSNETDNN